jgi:hypothetical protein
MTGASFFLGSRQVAHPGEKGSRRRHRYYQQRSALRLRPDLGGILHFDCTNCALELTGRMTTPIRRRDRDSCMDGKEGEW